MIGNIECKHDLGYSRKDTDKITAKKSQFGKAFKSLCFTTDGEYLIAGGKSKFICIYNAKEQILVKRFEISCNKSFDGIDVSYGFSFEICKGSFNFFLKGIFGS